jgi:serine/threonine-protein kinase HipA
MAFPAVGFVVSTSFAQVRTIRQRFDAVCDEARLGDVDRHLLRTRQFLNPYAFEGAPERVRAAAGL